MRLVEPVSVLRGEWIALEGGFERVVEFVCEGGGLMRDGGSPSRKFGWCDTASDVGVPCSWKE